MHRETLIVNELSRQIHALCAVAIAALLVNVATAKPIKHQITGLFAAEREQDLRDAFAKIDKVKLVSIDFKNAEATLDYDPAKTFPKAKPEQILQQLDNLLKTASNHTFGIKALRTVPRQTEAH